VYRSPFARQVLASPDDADAVVLAVTLHRSESPNVTLGVQPTAAALARRRREPEPVEAPEQIGARLYSSTTQPLTVTITFTMPPKRREVYMRLAAKQKGVSEERFFAEAIGPVMIRAVDDYLERHE
jgi:hypothetical protein